jgi:cellulose synthase/poly-beta-1,6-N-acetylglucosamine synthase-like glycosyltransferase
VITEVAPTASVIIACRGDVVEMLREQLEALAGQDFTEPWELLIADNGITDDVVSLLADYADRLPQARMISVDQRPGRSYAINQSVLVAGSDLLITLDSDDVVTPGYLREMVAALGRHDFVGARLDSVTLNPRWLRDRRRALQASQLEYLLEGRKAVIGAGMALTRRAFDRVSGFDEEMLTLEDLDVSFRLQLAGIRPHFASAAVVRYRYRQNAWGLFRQERSYGRGAALLYRKHRGVLPRRRLRQSVRGWLDVLVAVPQLGTRTGRARLATTLGAAVGRLEGSLRHHVFHL